MLITREQFYLDIIFPSLSPKMIYNFCRIAGSTLGYWHTDECRYKLSVARTGAINPRTITIYVDTLDLMLVKVFPTRTEAAAGLGTSCRSFGRCLDTGVYLKPNILFLLYL
jgi:hypothetical protein